MKKIKLESVSHPKKRRKPLFFFLNEQLQTFYLTYCELVVRGMLICLHLQYLWPDKYVTPDLDEELTPQQHPNQVFSARAPDRSLAVFLRLEPKFLQPLSR